MNYLIIRGVRFVIINTDILYVYTTITNQNFVIKLYMLFGKLNVGGLYVGLR